MLEIKNEAGFTIRTLCEVCQNAVPNGKDRGCEWSISFLPVPMWNAIRTQLKMSDKYVESYSVQECPKYIPDKPRQPLPCDKYIVGKY